MKKWYCQGLPNPGVQLNKIKPRFKDNQIVSEVSYCTNVHVLAKLFAQNKFPSLFCRQWRHRYVIYQKFTLLKKQNLKKISQSGSILGKNFEDYSFCAALILRNGKIRNIFLVLRSCREYKFNLLDIWWLIFGLCWWSRPFPFYLEVNYYRVNSLYFRFYFRFQNDDRAFRAHNLL